jgi:menaquinone-dependent protoporphyrinogen oxidase
MNVLVAYASKYGATRGIAERLADRLRAAGLEAQAEPVTTGGDLSEYGAFVIGGAAYLGHWLKEATEYGRRNGAVLASQPTWLFSSGPLGTEPTDAEGRDLRLAAEPKEFAEFKETIKPVGTRVFFGALDPGKLGFRDRAMRTLPAGRALFPEGDFRDWPDIDAWATGIALELTPNAGGPTNPIIKLRRKS